MIPQTGNLTGRPVLADKAVLAAFFASGFSALVYQVAWFRMNATVLGNSVHASAAVLAAFMAGLAIGSRVFGLMAPRLKSPLFVYALQEAVIGLWALATPWMITHLYVIFVPISRHIPATPAAGTTTRFLVALLPMLLPTVLMGGTLPVLAEYFTRTGRAPLFLEHARESCRGGRVRANFGAVSGGSAGRPGDGSPLPPLVNHHSDKKAPDPWMGAGCRSGGGGGLPLRLQHALCP